MKIFDTNKNGWDEKTNFVDENNVMLGFDRGQSCCETASWYIGDNEKPTSKEIDLENQELEDVENWRFDARYFEQTDEVLSGEEPSDLHDPTIRRYNVLDSGAVATFKLIHSDGRQKFLHLFNIHNGYYGHGFKFEAPNNTFESYL